MLQGRYIYFLAATAVAVMHEYAHALAAESRGYVLDTVTLMPYGAVLQGGEQIDRRDAVRIAIAGPLSNFALCALIPALWWAFPAVYPYTECIFETSLVIGVFNLLPIYPLDGARIIVALSKKPEKALKGMRYAGIAASIIFLGLYIASYFYKLNYTLGVMAALVFLSATGGTDAESYRCLAKCAQCLKDVAHPVAQTRLAVGEQLKLIRLLKRINISEMIEFTVLDANMKPLATLNEEEVGELCLKFPLNTPVGEAVRGAFPPKKQL